MCRHMAGFVVFLADANAPGATWKSTHRNYTSIRFEIAHCQYKRCPLLWSTQETLSIPLIEVQFESVAAVEKSFPSISHLLYFSVCRLNSLLGENDA